MNILTFDVEEWFHILDNQSTKTETEWLKYEVRIHQNMERIFQFLTKHNLSATFFVVGWIAKKYPEVVKKIDKLGFEIGSHTYMHQLMYEQSPREVEEDLKQSIYVLEDLTGKKVRSFRAPGFSITKKNKWAFEVLASQGITHDCSVFPAGRAHGGLPSYKEAVPSRLICNGVELKEFPINTTCVFGNSWIFSGGGYFRLSPYPFVKKWSKKSDYIMTYFHPRDFDPDQPIIKELSLTRKFKSYVGLKSCMTKLNKWVGEFDFIDLKTADMLIDWDQVPIIKI